MCASTFNEFDKCQVDYILRGQTCLIILQ